MTYAEADEDISFRTNTSSSTFPLADRVRIANNFLVKLSTDLNKVDEDLLGLTAYFDLVSGRREYGLPSEIVSSKIEKVEALLDGTNWALLTEIDLNSWGDVTSEANIAGKFGLTTGTAFYDVWRKGLTIYSQSIPGSAGGLKISALGEIDPLTVAKMTGTTDMSEHPGTDEESWKHGIPKQFHELMCIHVSREYKMANDRETPLTEVEAKLGQDYMFQIENMKNTNLSRETRRNSRGIASKHNFGYDY